MTKTTPATTHRQPVTRTLLITAALLNTLAGSPTQAVLSVHPHNPLYFADGSDEAVYLAGHQIFVDLQDNSFNKTFTRDRARTLDWNRYLEFLTAQDFNYVRNWVIWSTGSGAMAPRNDAIASPMPYERVPGRGKARDGRDKFDLDRFNEAFFERMRRRCEDLGQRGVYVSIMLFEVYGFLEGEAVGDPKQTLWDGNVFNRANNVNGIHTDDNGDGKGIEFFYTRDPRVLALQKQYVRKVIETVNDLDNVFYEIANELHAPQWQHDMIAFIKACERTRPKQHLILMSPGGRTAMGRWTQMPRRLVVDSGADCFAVAGSWNSRAYRQKNPPANDVGKPGIVDMDHVSAGSSDVGFVWSAFTRGYHFNLYDKPFESPEAEGPAWERVRANVSQTVAYARRMDLSQTWPRGDLASTGFCLANPGEQYVVYQPGDGAFDVSGLHKGTAYRCEWYHPDEHRVGKTQRFIASSTHRSFTLANEHVVLFIERCRDSHR